MAQDLISDMLTILRNAIMVKKKTVIECPYSKNNYLISQILLEEGFINGTAAPTKNHFSKVLLIGLKFDPKTKKSPLHSLKRISKPSLRWYSSNPIPQALGGLGIFIVSTNLGIMTDKEARAKKLGGEILLEVW